MAGWKAEEMAREMDRQTGLLSCLTAMWFTLIVLDQLRV